MARKYLFGPVPSRRLGRSLGIDLLPAKVCTLDCVYCECGATQECTLDRREYVPTDAVIAELDAALENRPELDSITFSGSGEPCLHAGLGTIIRHLKNKYPEYRITVLTNGTLLTDPFVREELSEADLVVPSLDAVSADVFESVNRPHPDLDNERVIDGLVTFRGMYKGLIWLEIFIIPGKNDTPDELRALVKAVDRIQPDRVQLNSLDRPAAYEGVTVPTPEHLLEIVTGYFPGADIVSRHFIPVPEKAVPRELSEAILEILRRRPLNLDDVRVQFSLHVHEAHKIMRHLVESGRVRLEGSFYLLNTDKTTS